MQTSCFEIVHFLPIYFSLTDNYRPNTQFSEPLKKEGKEKAIWQRRSAQTVTLAAGAIDFNDCTTITICFADSQNCRTQG